MQPAVGFAGTRSASVWPVAGEVSRPRVAGWGWNLPAVERCGWTLATTRPAVAKRGEVLPPFRGHLDAVITHGEDLEPGEPGAPRRPAVAKQLSHRGELGMGQPRDRVHAATLRFPRRSARRDAWHPARACGALWRCWRETDAPGNRSSHLLLTIASRLRTLVFVLRRPHAKNVAYRELSSLMTRRGRCVSARFLSACRSGGIVRRMPSAAAPRAHHVSTAV